MQIYQSDRVIETEDLVAAGDEIFDAETVKNALAAIVVEGDGVRARNEAAKILREQLKRGQERIRAAFKQTNKSGFRIARSICWLTDQIVCTAFEFVVTRLFPLHNPTKGERITLAAVGGYGRGEMAPFSDVDLLFLTPYKQTAWGETIIEATLYLLWDLKMKVGHSSRSIDECIRLGSSDLTIRTALLEARFLSGEARLFADLERRLWLELFENTGPDFVEAKLAERDARHSRQGGSRYLLEPNVKESKGGLRDLQTLVWIAKYLYNANSMRELVARGVFTSHEVLRFERAESHLWSVRCALHYNANRANDRLTFDQQVEIAELFGYHDRDGQRAVERFMKRYFIAAKEVGNLTRIFCAALEHQHKKRQPVVGGLFRFFTSSQAVKPELEWIEMKDGRMFVPDPQMLRNDPTNILRLLSVAVEADVRIHPTTLRMIERSKFLIDEETRSRPEMASRFLELIAHSRDPVRVLNRLNETNILGRLVPPFQRITGMMQFNMYHSYTVDEHTIRTIEYFTRIANGELAEDHPMLSKIAASLSDRRLMVVALLMHDIGKGLPEDHSIAGERIAREECPKLGFSAAETELIAWLVREHLTMSDTAQKRDISDIETIRGFAQIVRSPEKLRLLYLLTVCDIRGVGPDVWNNWKAQLLRDLYTATRDFLTGDGAEHTKQRRVAMAQEGLREALGHWTSEHLQAHFDRFSAPYWLGLETGTHVFHAQMLASYKGPLEIAVRQQQERDATEIAFLTADHPGLFARMAGAFALAGASVVDARCYTSKDGMTLNTFWVQDSAGEAYDDPRRIDGMKDAVRRTLLGEVVPREELPARRKLKKREMSFDIPPSVSFDNTGSEIYTIIEVNARDRVGLLHDLARALSSVNVNIASAIIATYGEHVVDVFYVKDLFGMRITQPNKQKQIEEALMAAIDRATRSANRG
ncbi:MAG: [protein-PII] uridylyltransferase [Neomegalonema sp.]|nr:[protein-PII] uridylyltransferase [Neomegalonema sp.]